jgi:ElaA protein
MHAARTAPAQATGAAPAAPLVEGGLHWRWARFDAMGVHALHAALALRCRVFILEQGPYQDPDEADLLSWHLLGCDDSGAARACLRVVDPGVKYAEPSIGRVVIAPEWRGRGLGHVLVRLGLAQCQALWPGQGVRISAQAHLQSLYGAHGFVAVSEPYLEDDIAHIEMLCPPAGA